ncbi:signal peptide peptidase SppA [Erwinia sp. OLTSP20]|uniref:signal peptide peptidase SppA n=1 Tax=unclassified Erwinia TaxID=2622719 RepID=UPI000C17729F|nr:MULTISPECIES: signal peptide peptidase SppA [unclassified Erwinia]PIJ51637.1 signal peptide peptidase SppA [Erwinia sp. OAMSP11]PIJ69714.1 signal peptide peptidase SppA [Erwinia sp. OLSSP12]PIJ79437.1 signal peptide peptidase SppA [Erwinia sp. OLCASP19]PIJ86607.1 signal peptide peptidase SppA [Erwinia sp. OLMTSP26]PIJ88048.1 signal peptide peptidase SppA [Erwinia sp. OLMDSP33]
MRTLWRIIANLFKWTWRLINFIREFILNLFLLLLILVGVGIWMQVKSSSQPVEIQKGALDIDLAGVVVDNPSVTNKISKWGRQLIGASSNRLKENPLFDIVNAIRQAKTDDRISGIVLNLRDFAGGDQPSLQYIGKALREFRDSGKPIYAYGDNYTQAQYYLASFANHIYLSPHGSIDLHGFATNSLYYKSLLDRLKVSSHIFRVGTYKSAVEPFLRDDMSPAARDADSRWVGQLWQNYIAQIAANRQITPQQVFPGAQQLIAALQQNGGDMAQYAKATKLVDELATPAEVDQKLSKVFGWDKQSNDYRGTSIYDYSLKKQAEKGNIAVIYADGAIVDGEQTPGAVGGDTTAAEIRSARLDDNIKAIILRVNSPGGSVTASETIREELAAARTAGKPVVVSMGGMAASGGYWISTPASYIIASPSTLTGSIGIFGIINTVEKSLDSLGVHTDGVATSPLADVSVTKTLPPEVQQIMQLTIENGYKNFVDLVARSRKMTPEQVDAIAQGHVWTGSDAKANGLVDELGDFDDAINKAAELAKISQPQLQWYQYQSSVADLLLGQVSAQIRAVLPDTLQSMLPAPLNDVMGVVKKQPGLFDKMNDPQSRYALCLTCGEVG